MDFEKQHSYNALQVIRKSTARRRQHQRANPITNDDYGAINDYCDDYNFDRVMVGLIFLGNGRISGAAISPVPVGGAFNPGQYALKSNGRWKMVLLTNNLEIQMLFKLEKN